MTYLKPPLCWRSNFLVELFFGVLSTYILVDFEAGLFKHEDSATPGLFVA